MRKPLQGENLSIIRKKRINKLESNIGFVPKGASIVAGITVREDHEQIITRIGFSFPPSIGDTLLPPASLGPVSKRNAEGTYIIHKDRPKETAYRQIEWTWEQWAGRYYTETQSRLVDVPYERYPRTHVLPYSVELTVQSDTEDHLVLVSPSIDYTDENEDELKHILNLFLEIFGEVQIFTEDLDEIMRAPLRRLNWNLLPEGHMPWEQLQQHINPIINTAPSGNQPFIIHRFEKINEFNPDFYAIGKAGFWGYVIFGFEDKNLYVCESIHYGNATYVFAEDWEELSKMTKAQILDNNLQEERIIHRVGSWERRINEVLT